MMRGFQFDLDLPRVFPFSLLVERGVSVLTILVTASPLQVFAPHEKPHQLRKLEEPGHGHVMDTEWNGNLRYCLYRRSSYTVEGHFGKRI